MGGWLDWNDFKRAACVSFQMPKGEGGSFAAAEWYSFCNYCHTDRPLHSLSLRFQGGERGRETFGLL